MTAKFEGWSLKQLRVNIQIRSKTWFLRESWFKAISFCSQGWSGDYPRDPETRFSNSIIGMSGIFLYFSKKKKNMDHGTEYSI